jgi:queuine tRNA-ribosyltransferase
MLTTPCGTFTYPETKKINLLNTKYRTDHSALDPLSTGYVSKKYTKAYVAHLFRAGEILGPHLASIHNLNFIVKFTENLREQLLMT